MLNDTELKAWLERLNTVAVVGMSTNPAKAAHRVPAYLHTARGDVALIWLQLGIVNETARALAEAAGIPFVQDRCMAIEIPRLFPGGRVKR